jgi:hypothetical protein
MNMTVAASLTNHELTLLTILFGVTLLLCATFLAYTIYDEGLAEIRESGVMSLLVQFCTIVLTAYGLLLLMSANVITSQAGLPALTGLVGFLLGKAPGALEREPGSRGPSSRGTRTHTRRRPDGDQDRNPGRDDLEGPARPDQHDDSA